MFLCLSIDKLYYCHTSCGIIGLIVLHAVIILLLSILFYLQVTLDRS